MAATLRQRGEVYAPPRYDAYIVLLVISLVPITIFVSNFFQEKEA